MKEQVIAEIVVVPIGTESTEVSKYVARCLDVVKEAKGVTYVLTAMSTIVQGPLSRVLEVYERMHEVPFGMGGKRVLSTLKIDDRRDKLATIEGKVKSVSEKGSV